MIRPFATGCAVVWAGVVACLNTLNVLAPQRDGALAVTQVFAPYLFLPLAAAIVLWRQHGRGGRLLRVLLVACGTIFAVRFLPGWIPWPSTADPGATMVAVTSWNLKLGEADPVWILDGLRTDRPGFIALVELTPRHAGPIDADPGVSARFPYRSLHPMDNSAGLGLGLLSSYPFIGAPEMLLDPPMLVARADFGNGKRVTVVVAHPVAAEIGQDLMGVSVTAYDPSKRDAQIRAIRAALDAPIAANEPVILVGDFNVTDREPAYGDLARGLIDAHHAVGIGPGATWRPPGIEWLPFGLLRIDMLFTGGSARPLTIAPDCTPRGSDHCILSAIVQVPR